VFFGPGGLPEVNFANVSSYPLPLGDQTLNRNADVQRRELPRVPRQRSRQLQLSRYGHPDVPEQGDMSMICRACPMLTPKDLRAKS
jgi:hypothetical protein